MGVLVIAILTVAAHATSKCDWNSYSRRCSFDTANIPASGNLRWDTYVTYGKRVAACAKVASQTNCTSDSNCIWSTFHGVCYYTDEHKRESIYYGDRTNCDSLYNPTEYRDCSWHETEADCNTGPCSWTAHAAYDANNVSTIYSYSAKYQRCVGKPSFTPAHCTTDYYKLSFGLSFDQSKLSNDAYKVFRPAQRACASVNETNEETMNACLRESTSVTQTRACADVLLFQCLKQYGACDNMLTLAQLKLYRKLHDYTITFAEDVLLHAEAKACTATYFGDKYANTLYDGKFANLTAWQPAPSCPHNLLASTCSATSGCGHAGGLCHTLESLREQIGADAKGGASCIYSRLQAQKGLHGLNDTELIAKYEPMADAAAVCHSFNVGEGGEANASCSAENKCTNDTNHTYVCDSNGDATWDTSFSTCRYDKGTEPGHDAKEHASFALLFDQVTDSLWRILTACDAIDTEDECRQATLTEAEIAALAETPAPTPAPLTLPPPITATSIVGALSLTVPDQTSFCASASVALDAVGEAVAGVAAVHKDHIDAACSSNRRLKSAQPRRLTDVNVDYTITLPDRSSASVTDIQANSFTRQRIEMSIGSQTPATWTAEVGAKLHDKELAGLIDAAPVLTVTAATATTAREVTVTQTTTTTGTTTATVVTMTRTLQQGYADPDAAHDRQPSLVAPLFLFLLAFVRCYER